MKSRAIIITGGEGFIASNFIKKLLKEEKNLNIISLDSNYNLYPTKINNKRIIYVKGKTKFIFSKLQKYIKKFKIDTLFHFGEFSRIVASFENYADCIDSNVVGTIEVIKFCVNNNLRIIYSASSSKFGNKGRDENLSPYSWTKSKNIELIKNIHNWFGMNYTIVYFFNVYGPGQIKKGKMASVIGIFENQYENNLPLTVVGKGELKRDFTHVDDICDGIYLTWKKKIQDDFLLGTGENHRIIDIARRFNSDITFIKSRPGERLKSAPIDNKSQKILGYKPKKNIYNYIDQFIKKNGS